jgi:phosphate/sulfate permease
MAVIDLGRLDLFQLACLVIAVAMLFWDTVEVGRNDAANLVNAVFGARVLNRRIAVLLAGVAVVLGAVLSSDVIDTARKGIFDPAALGSLKAALAVYISVYIVDTVLLYSYSAFGMPVSTTACLVFELLGAAMAINTVAIRWPKAGMVLGGIVCSIFLAGVMAFLIQRAVRGAVRDRSSQLSTLLLHGGWIGGGLAAGLCYFLLLKGMKHVSAVQRIQESIEHLNETLEADIGYVVLLLFMWGVFAIIIHVLLVIFRKKAAKLLFPVLAVLGMLAMAFAFGQNDLANCASPGLAAVSLLRANDVEVGTEVPIAWWMLLICGLLLFLGMNTRNAERVTKTAVATGSMGHHVALWAPAWCVGLATNLLRFRGEAPALAPRAGITEAGKTIHFDALRGSVIMSVSASIVATASSLGLPVSTTYVTFAAVVATGMADRIFQRGDAELKLARAIWVAVSWFLSAGIAAVCAFLVTKVVFALGVAGIIGCLVLNLGVRHVCRKRADRQAVRVAEEAYERAHPEEFALEQEDA